MTKPRRWTFLVVASCLAPVCLAPAVAGPDDPPEFEQEEGYTLTVLTYRAGTDIDYDSAEVTHEVELTCRVSAPDRLDVVCLRQVLTVVEAEDDEGDDIYLPPTRRGRGSTDADYVAFEDGVVELELKSAELSRSAFTIQRLVVETEAVIAEERDEFEMPAIVMDDDLETPFDTSVRISEMKIGRDHEANITIEFDRETEPGRPLPEAVYALDEDGNVLGGGRWTTGTDIFSGRGEFEAEFLVADDADVTTLRLVFLTEYALEPVTFEVVEIFQR